MSANANGALIQCTDHEGKLVGRLEWQTGKMYLSDGSVVQMHEQGIGDQSDADVLRAAGLRDPVELNAYLSQCAADFDVRRRGTALRKELRLKATGGSDAARRRGECKVLMDLGVGDVHIPSAMSNIALGYHLEDGVADIASPIIPAVKQSDFFFTWNQSNQFTPANVTMGAAGGAPAEVSPAISNTKYTAQEFALASYVPTEIEANADAPLQPYQQAIDMVMAKLRMAREMRVAAVLTTTANWNSNNVLTLTAGQQWDGGASADPIANFHAIVNASLAKVSRMVMGGPIFRALQRNTAVRAYHTPKTNDPALPNAQELSRILELPPIIVAEMKYTNLTASTTPTFVWPSAVGSASSVVLLHEPSQNPPSSGRDISSAYSYRWTNAPAPDGTVTGGFMVRSYYDPRRGGRGGRVVVVVHNDADVLTGPLVGGLITNVM